MPGDFRSYGPRDARDVHRDLIEASDLLRAAHKIGRPTPVSVATKRVNDLLDQMLDLRRITDGALTSTQEL